MLSLEKCEQLSRIGFLSEKTALSDVNHKNTSYQILLENTASTNGVTVATNTAIASQTAVTDNHLIIKTTTANGVGAQI